MPKHKLNRYCKRTLKRSAFDGTPTLVINQYWLPKPYVEPVANVIALYRQGKAFNTAVDIVAMLYADTVNRNKLAEHTLKYIANDHDAAQS